MKISQLNTNRFRQSVDLTWELTFRNNVEIILLSEPNRGAVTGPTWVIDRCMDAAIGFPVARVPVAGNGNGSGFVWADLVDVVLISCYHSPNTTTEDFVGFLDALEKVVRQHRGRNILMAGDFNAKSPEFGGNVRNIRGNLLAD
ncbi:uncharacterized protein LOC142330656 [Lycorma delicatula]|uniref:uncharacterized protein LOC142330656 n=1 Tax=Lycorma delicatula TaxID=130591 RepID=UPI003F515689